MARRLSRTGLSVAWRVLALALLVSASAAAQTTLGRVAGTVLDQSGGVLPGATITLTHTGTGQVMTTVSGDTGAFLFPQVPVGSYKVQVSLEGFKAAEFTDVAVAVAQEYSLTAKLSIGALTDVVTVVSGASLVSTTTPEVTSTVMQRQVLDIPLVNRDVTNLIKLQAGVAGVANRANTVINGGRPTWTQVTLDGINIQDNFIRTNSLDFLPNRPTSDNVAEFSITTSVAGADAAGGATAIRMVTPSGTNRFSGSVFEFNRDSKFAANTFFNNAAKPSVAKPELSRHQFGGRIAGPIKRDKLFFFFNYEGFRQETQIAQNLTIPANADFYNGVFRYTDLSGNVQSVNVMQLSGLSIDPKVRSDVLARIPAASNVNNFDVGNSTAARLLNTAGYRFLQNDLNDRNSYTGRVDYAMTPAHKFEGVFSYFKEIDDRTDQDVVSPRPLVYTSSDPKRFAAGWRWAPTSRFNNELRGGANLAPAHFLTDWDFGDGILYNTVLNITNPVAGFQAQGRYTDTYQLNDNASYLMGSHQLQMGGSWQRNRVNPYNFAAQYPTVTFGFSSVAPTSVQLNSAQFPGGIASGDLTNANNMAAFLGGVITQTAQTFRVRDKTSGYVPGIPSNEFLTLDNIALFVQDNWRWKPNFTVRGGLKWEYYSPLSEDNDLGLLPILRGSFHETMLSPNTTLTFVNGEFYKKDLDNFGPTAGFAWDLTKDGRTAVRGGYSLTFVNEDTITVARAVSTANAGLSTAVTLPNQFTTVSSGVPLPATPTFLTERTLNDQLAVNPQQAVLWGIDPNIKAPHVHQVSVGIQRELPWAFAVEARYVGTFGRGIWRGTDNNQIQLHQNFVDDFKRARSNGYLAQQAGLTWSPVFNANVAGSQALTVLPNYGLLTNANVVANIQQNQVAGLIDFYLQNLPSAAARADARATFLQNPGIYSSNQITNGGFTDFNSFQLEVRRQFRNGLFAQVNYTLSDSHTDSDGTGQNRFEAFMDNNRPELNHGRSVFHVTHVMNANAIYELPFGRDRTWLNGDGLSNVLVGGWQVGTIVALQSGSPLTIFSGRGTFNRVGRSNCGGGLQTICNTAVSTLSVAEIQKLIGIYKQPDGRIFWIDPKVIDAATGRAVGPDNLGNSAGFPGQIFFNPGAGEVGNLPVMAFEGPKVFRIDLALSKRTRIADRYNLELKGEAFNLTNSVSFARGDMDINAQNFGRITQTAIPSRVVQISARFDF